MEDCGSALAPAGKIAATHFGVPAAESAPPAAFGGPNSSRGDVSRAAESIRFPIPDVENLRKHCSVTTLC